jgi:hypothetical protein
MIQGMHGAVRQRQVDEGERAAAASNRSKARRARGKASGLFMSRAS